MMAAVVILAILLFIAAQVRAQQPILTPDQVTDDQVMEVARSLYCPVCPNEPLDTCQTQACYQWREDIRARLAAGQTRDEIIAAFVAQYGERASAIPLDQGLRGLAVFTPLALGIVALVIAVVLIWRWRTAHAPTPAADQSSSAVADDVDAYRARIEEDLK